MKTSTYFDKYYDITLKIHDICNKKHISIEDTRLLVYIHITLLNNKKSIDALEFLLNNTSTNTKLNNISQDINILDRKIQKEEGLETKLSGELNRRLKFHTNKIFRNKMLTIYKTIQGEL